MTDHDYQSNSMMDPQRSRLLLLPYELRMTIFEYAVEGERHPPGEPRESLDRTYEQLYKIKVLYPKTFSTLNSALLRISRQCHHEFQALLNRQPHLQIPICKLDLMVNGLGVWPTWTLPPRLKSSEEYDLDVELRLFDVVEVDPLFLVDTCPGTNGYPGLLSQPFLVILNRILHYGPQLSQPDPNAEGMRIRKLKMNMHHCVTDCDGPCEMYWGRSLTPYWMFTTLSGFMAILEGEGLLFGKVAEMELISRAIRQRVIIPVSTQGEGEIPRGWAPKGHSWGPSPNA